MNDNDEGRIEGLDRLARTQKPRRDLWPGIEARLVRRPRAVRPLWAYSLAASVLVAVAAGALWSLGLHRGGGTPQEIVATGQSPESAYFAQRAAYAESSVQTATNLAPATRQVILKNLRIIESSIQDMQDALDKDPNNPRLRALLFDLYQNEARLLAATQQAQAQTNARNSL